MIFFFFTIDRQGHKIMESIGNNNIHYMQNRTTSTDIEKILNKILFKLSNENRVDFIIL